VSRNAATQHGRGRNQVPAVSIIGRKNSGKTTLLAALAAELKRRGLRVASIKHCHHGFDVDRTGSDSWRHYEEGEVEAVLLAAPGRFALLGRAAAGQQAPDELIATHLGHLGFDLVLVEAFTESTLPKLEVFRRAVHDEPLFPLLDRQQRDRYIGIVTDDPGSLEVPVPVVEITRSGAHIAAAADLILASVNLKRDDNEG
jgi:molybdopterin-guanine dinucleotide biosynthesis protein MobB